MRLSAEGRKKVVNKGFRQCMGKSGKPCETEKKTNKTGVAILSRYFVLFGGAVLGGFFNVLIYTFSRTVPSYREKPLYQYGMVVYAFTYFCRITSRREIIAEDNDALITEMGNKLAA